MSILIPAREANALVEPILSGHKFVPKDDLLLSPYRYLHHGEVDE